jgi:ADP-ribose pyrophosphatase YjhB (NUDIX family)
MKCSYCGMIYFHNTASAVGAVIETPEGILLVKRNHEPRKGFFDVPGGFVNYNETLENALIREIDEELSIKVQNINYFRSYPNVYEYEGITYFTTDVFFRCTLDKIPNLSPNDEIAEFKYFNAAEIPFEQLAFQSAVKALKDFNNLYL